MAENNKRYYWDEFHEKVERGLDDDAVWMPLALPKLSKYTGIVKQLYTLLGGDPGTGKSAFTHLNYILKPYYEWKKAGKKEGSGMDLNIILRSMERSRDYIIGKWVCWMLWQQWGILIDVPTVYGWGSGDDLDSGVYEKIQKTKDWFYEMEDDCLTIIDGGVNPTGIWKQATNFMKKRGKVYKPSQHERKFEPYDENELNLLIIDHIGCLTQEREYGRKQTLDKMSEYIRSLRDLYRMTCVVVNQFNRSLSDSTRRTRMTMAPEKQDFKGSGNMYEDCDVAMGLFNPAEYHIEENLDYQMGSFLNSEGFNRYRSLYLLKNTYGISNISLGMNFIGEIGHFRELPKASHMTPEKYEKARNAQPW